MKGYKVVEYSNICICQKNIEDFLNEMARNDWIFKTILHRSGMESIELIFERDK